MLEAQDSALINLPIAETLQLIQAVWDSMTDAPQEIPVSDWHKEELARRKKAYQQNPEGAASWNAVKARVQPN